jgi:hypothetical protein
MMFAYLTGGRGAVVMTNGDRGSALAAEVLRSIAAEYGWPDYQQQEKAIAVVSEETLRTYAGVYRFPNGPKVTVREEKGKLWVTLPQGESVEVLPESSTSFFSVNDGVPALRFARKDDDSVELTAGGATAKRQ